MGFGDYSLSGYFTDSRTEAPTTLNLARKQN